MTKGRFNLCILVVLALLCMPIAFFAQTPGIANVRADTGTVAQSITSSYWFRITFSSEALTDPAYPDAATAISANITVNHWNCLNPQNYLVQLDTGNGKNSTVTIRRVSLDPATPACNQAFTPTTAGGHVGNASYVVLWVDENQPLLKSYSGTVTVSLVNLKGPAGKPMTIESKPAAAKVAWKFMFLTVSAQTVNNEALIDKSVYKKAIYQFPLSSTWVLKAYRRGGFYADSKDLVSTNERDSKSAFEGGLGYQVGTLPQWSLPVKIEGQVQGNQVASNLSSVVKMQFNTNPIWFGALTPTKDWPAFNNGPALTLALPYTHRFDQLLASGSKPLPIDDFAVNPALALSKERLFEKRTDQQVRNMQTASFTLGWEADLGLYYLPLQTTAKGSQRVEGYGDASVLIPLKDFGIIPGVVLDSSTQVNQMQLRIKYQDAVSATNNYVRTKGWTFGLELAVSK
jgi:hypothetical protein